MVSDYVWAFVDSRLTWLDLTSSWHQYSITYPIKEIHHQFVNQIKYLDWIINKANSILSHNLIHSRYKSLHLRLEDDWIKHYLSRIGLTFPNKYSEYGKKIIIGSMLFSFILKSLLHKFHPNDTIFIATNLRKKTKHLHEWELRYLKRI